MNLLLVYHHCRLLVICDQIFVHFRQLVLPMCNLASRYHMKNHLNQFPKCTNKLYLGHHHVLVLKQIDILKIDTQGFEKNIKKLEN